MLCHALLHYVLLHHAKLRCYVTGTLRFVYYARVECDKLIIILKRFLVESSDVVRNLLAFLSRRRNFSSRFTTANRTFLLDFF